MLWSISIRGSVRPSVHRAVRPSVRRSVIPSHFRRFRRASEHRVASIGSCYFSHRQLLFCRLFPSLYFRLSRLFSSGPGILFLVLKVNMTLRRARYWSVTHFLTFRFTVPVTGHYLGLFSFLILHFPFHPSSIGHTLVAFKGHTDFSLSSVLYEAAYFLKRMERWELLELVVV